MNGKSLIVRTARVFVSVTLRCEYEFIVVVAEKILKELPHLIVSNANAGGLEDYSCRTPRFQFVIDFRPVRAAGSGD